MKKGCLRVCVPFADLRKEPADRSSGYERDSLQQTQVLHNELLDLIDEQSEWYFVEAPEQIRTDAHGNTGGYPGWVRKSAVVEADSGSDYNAVVSQLCALLSSEPFHEGVVLGRLPLGSRLSVEANNDTADWLITRLPNGTGWIPAAHVNTHPVVSNEQLRENLIRTAELFIGLPYLWGGRSTCPTEAASHRAQGARHKAQGTGHMAQFSTKDTNSLPPLSFNLYPGSTAGAVYGVDCSGFTNLVYRAHFIDIPRDAADQAAVCARITADMLKPADLIFVSAQKASEEIVHVMLSLGGEEFIEAAETGSLVRRCTFKEKYGFTAGELIEKQFKVDGRDISFGSILKQRTTK